jgi:hypothetical protein
MKLSLTFPFIDIRLQKTTPRLSKSATPRLGEPATRLFVHEGHLFPSKIREKRPEYVNFGLFLRPSIIALYKKSSLYFTSVDLLSVEFIKSYR